MESATAGIVDRLSSFVEAAKSTKLTSGIPDNVSHDHSVALQQPRPDDRERDTQELEDMTIIIVMSETLPLAEIKAHLSEIVDRIEREHDRVTLTRNGRPAAVILSPDDLEALEDTLELLSDSKALKEIRAARDEVARGRVVTAEQLRAKYLKG
jgi:antitoxin YefM